MAAGLPLNLVAVFEERANEAVLRARNSFPLAYDSRVNNAVVGRTRHYYLADPNIPDSAVADGNPNELNDWLVERGLEGYYFVDARAYEIAGRSRIHVQLTLAATNDGIPIITPFSNPPTFPGNPGEGVPAQTVSVRAWEEVSAGDLVPSLAGSVAYFPGTPLPTPSATPAAGSALNPTSVEQAFLPVASRDTLLSFLSAIPDNMSNAFPFISRPVQTPNAPDQFPGGGRAMLRLLNHSCLGRGRIITISTIWIGQLPSDKLA